MNTCQTDAFFVIFVQGYDYSGWQGNQQSGEFCTTPSLPSPRLFLVCVTSRSAVS